MEVEVVAKGVPPFVGDEEKRVGFVDLPDLAPDDVLVFEFEGEAGVDFEILAEGLHVVQISTFQKEPQYNPLRPHTYLRAILPTQILKPATHWFVILL